MRRRECDVSQSQEVFLCDVREPYSLTVSSFPPCRSFLSPFSGLDHWRTFKHSNWTLQPMGSLRSVSYPGGFQMILPLLTGSRGVASGGTGDVETPPPFFVDVITDQLDWSECDVAAGEDAESSARRGTAGRLQDPKTSKSRSRKAAAEFYVPAGPWEGSIGSVYVSFLLEPQQGALFCGSTYLVVGRGNQPLW